MKTDSYFNYMGENFSRDQLKAGLGKLKNAAAGLVAWIAPLFRPLTHQEEMASARLEALRAALERFMGLAGQIDVDAPVEALEGELNRLTAIIWGVALSTDGLEEGAPLRLAGGPQAIKDLEEVLIRLRDETESLTPDSASMAREMMEHGRILTFEDEEKSSVEAESPSVDRRLSILVGTVQRELKRLPTPPEGWTAANVQRAIFPELGEALPVLCSGHISPMIMAALEALSRRPEPAGGWRMVDIKLAITEEARREAWNRPLTEQEKEDIRIIVKTMAKTR